MCESLFRPEVNIVDVSKEKPSVEHERVFDFREILSQERITDSMETRLELQEALESDSNLSTNSFYGFLALTVLPKIFIPNWSGAIGGNVQDKVYKALEHPTHYGHILGRMLPEGMLWLKVADVRVFNGYCNHSRLQASLKRGLSESRVYAKYSTAIEASVLAQELACITLLYPNTNMPDLLPSEDDIAIITNRVDRVRSNKTHVIDLLLPLFGLKVVAPEIYPQYALSEDEWQAIKVDMPLTVGLNKYWEYGFMTQVLSAESVRWSKSGLEFVFNEPLQADQLPDLPLQRQF